MRVWGGGGGGGGEGEELHSRTYTLKHKYTRIHAMLQFSSGLQ